MKTEAIIGLLNNLTMLISLVALSHLLPRRAHHPKPMRNIFTGLVCSAIVVVIMLNPWAMMEGRTLDSRSILLSLCGLFFGLVPTLITAVIAGITRIWMGGPYVVTGLINILVAAVAGVVWRHARSSLLGRHTWFELTVFGFLLHVVIIIVVFAGFPPHLRMTYLRVASFPVLVLFPIVTAVLGNLLIHGEAESAMKDSLRRLSVAVEGSGSAVVITDTTGAIIYVNRKFEQLTGYTREEALGRNPSILKSGDMSAEEYARLWSTIRQGGVWQGEFHNRRRNGELFWERASIAPVRDEDGDITHFIAIKEDITESKRMMAELIDAKNHAETSERMKDAFMAKVSHEIRTPLNLITGFLSLLEDDLDSGVFPVDPRYFKNIHAGVERLTRTIDLMLAVSRVDSGDIQMRVEELNLVPVLEQIADGFSLLARQKMISLVCDIPPVACSARIDRYMFTEAVSNLLDNALKFTREGSVTVRLHINGAGAPRIEIADTGIGISEQFKRDMYKPYKQEQEGYTRAFEGIGLGLALVKRYLDLNHIPITVESTKGKGTVFMLDLGAVCARA